MRFASGVVRFDIASGVVRFADFTVVHPSSELFISGRADVVVALVVSRCYLFFDKTGQ